MKTDTPISNGTKVEIVRPGYTYTTYNKKAEELGALSWDRKHLPNPEHLHTIVNSVYDRSNYLRHYLIQDDETGKEYIVDDNAFKIYSSVDTEKGDMKTYKITDLKAGDMVTINVDNPNDSYFKKGDSVVITSIDPVHERINGYKDGLSEENINFCDYKYVTPFKINGLYVGDTPTKATAKKKAKDIVHTPPDKESLAVVANARTEMKLIGLESERKAITLGIEGNFPVLLQGETGQGKTYLVTSIAKEMGKTCIRMSMNGEIGIGELVGRWLAKDGSTYWQDGILTECMKKGYWFIADEINMALPEILTTLNSVMDDARSLILAEKDGELVTAHEDFRIFATMNPPDEYVGTKEINKALLSRFSIVIPINNYRPATELKILQYQSGISKEIGSIMVDVGNKIRNLKKDKLVWYTCGTRDLVNWARLISCNGSTLQETFEYSILNKCSLEDRKVIEDGIKDACAIEFNWGSKKEEFAKLTAEMSIDIDRMKAEKDKLKVSLKKLRDMAEALSEEGGMKGEL